MNGPAALCASLALVVGAQSQAHDCSALIADAGDGNWARLGLTAPTDCTRLVVLGEGPQRSCRWAYGFRSPSATAAFDRLVAGLADCKDGPDDTGVNHPDSYDLMVFVSDAGQRLALSIKDKGALAQTLLFIRTMEGRDDGL